MSSFQLLLRNFSNSSVDISDFLGRKRSNSSDLWFDSSEEFFLSSVDIFDLLGSYWENSSEAFKSSGGRCNWESFLENGWLIFFLKRMSVDIVFVIKLEWVVLTFQRCWYVIFYFFEHVSLIQTSILDSSIGVVAEAACVLFWESSESLL